MDLGKAHARLVAGIDTTPEIRGAFAAHPRHRFIPDVIWPDPTGLPLIRSQKPHAWARTVYTDDAVTTQANDGGAGTVNTPTSSSSAPQVMADMIEAAGLGPGMRVLEVGAGTGWNAAVLCELVGARGRVTTVEVDPGVAEHAERALSGTSARVVTGTLHDAPGSYDAVLVTCSMNRIPAELAGFLAPGAAAVLPWSPDPQSHSTPVVAVRAEGDRLTGGFVREGSFMRSRDQRPPAERFPGLGAAPDAVGTFEAASDEVIDSGAMTPLMLMLPGVRIGVGMRPFDGSPRRIVYLGAPDGSWAYLWPDGALTMGGPTGLADRFTAAYRTLEGAGFPALTAFHLDAAPEHGLYRVSAEEIGEWVHEADRPASG
ncbi:methyltransferase domain-containing protein [Nocardiopsis potens]|uniref:methyltransferase domain-containing protein n=1 Tax=Nocardiopsis potens TaxID=1246458 RepID=UPI00034691A6|nr:methyltransferase domain-containing protein [Nocardiopsis potens]